MGVVVSDDDTFFANEYSMVAIDRMRAKIAHDLLSNKGLSFDKVIWEEQQDLVRMDAQEKKSLAEAMKATEAEEQKRRAAENAKLAKQKRKK